MNGLFWLVLLFLAAILVAAILGLFVGGGIWVLAAKLLTCLALAALLGALLGWLLKALTCGGGEWRDKFEDLESQFGVKNRELDGLKAELRSSKGEVDKYNLRFGEIEAERDKYKKAFLELEAKYKDLKDDFDAEQSGRSEIDSELSARTRSIADLGVKLHAKDAEIAELSSKLSAVGESDNKILDLENQLKLLADKNASFANLEKENSARFASLNAEVETGRNTIETLEKQVAEKERRIAALEADLSKSKSDVGKQSDLSSQINALRQESAAKDKRLVELEAELNKLRLDAGKAGEYEGQLNKLKLDLSERDSRIKELKSELESINTGRSEVDAELAARSKAIADFGIKLDSAKKDLATKEKRIAELEFNLAKAKKAAEGSQQYEAELAKLKAELKARDERIDGLESNLRELNTSRTDADKELEARGTAIADFGLKLEAAKKDLADKEKRIADLEFRLAKASKTAKSHKTQAAQASSKKAGGPNIHVRYLGDKIRLRGTVSANIHDRVIANAKRDLGAENIIDELETKNIGESPKWVEPALLSALGVSRDLKDASFDLDGKKVVLTGIVANEKESRNVESKIRRHLPSDIKLDNNLSVVGKDVKQDDLKEIKGIASVLEPVLHSKGVYTFRQIACWTASDVEQVREALGGFKGRIEREEWIRQARELHIKHYGEEPKCYGNTVSNFRASGGSGTSLVRTSSKDDLTRIEGIGPKMNKALLAAGITTFVQLAAASEDELRAAINAAGMSFAPSIKTWAKQAKYLVDGDEEGFLEYTEYLIAGRDVGDNS